MEVKSHSVDELERLLKAISLLLTNNKGDFRLLKSWIYQDNLIVFDCYILGLFISFDISIIKNTGSVLVEVFSRKKDDHKFISSLQYEKSNGNKYKLCELKYEENVSDNAIEIHKEIDIFTEYVQDREIHSEDKDFSKEIIGNENIYIIDVGANPLDIPPYSRLLNTGSCRVIGFEPQADAFEKLENTKKEYEEYFPYAIGKRGTFKLNIYRNIGFTSLFEIDKSSIGLFNNKNWEKHTTLKDNVSIDCETLDSIGDLPEYDLLKIDIQCGELDVFEGARRSLTSALCIITEVSFFPLYKNAPDFADVHKELVDQGFLLHKFMFQKSLKIEVPDQDGPLVRGNQLIDGDAVYLKDLRKMPKMSDREVKVIAMLAHFVFSSPDLAARALHELAARGCVSETFLTSYIHRTGGRPS